MKLDNFIASLRNLQAQGHGNKEVFYRHGGSGDCGPLGYPRVTDEVSSDTGPFDLPDGAEYISIYAGS
jgi:hypothetical protein